jgi:hypothetical protein
MGALGGGYTYTHILQICLLQCKQQIIGIYLFLPIYQFSK